MSSSDDREMDGTGDDLLAGEYVLGVLSLEDRQHVERRLRQDQAFAATVAGWENHLSSLNEAYQEVAPPAGLYARIEARLFPATALTAGQSRPGLWNSLLLWRGLAFGCAAAFAVYLAADQGWFRFGAPAAPLVAELSGQQEGSLTLLARYDAATGRLQVAPISAGPAQQHSLELWLVPGGADPAISLGVLPQTGEGAVEIPQQLRSRLGEGVTFAVSLEPLGGSPDGKPTGPVVAAGQARRP
jgi:anti-sigma-K factor RskA